MAEAGTSGTSLKGIILCIIILFILVIAAIVMAGFALGSKSSSGNSGFKVTKITSTGSTNITVDHPMYIQVAVTGTTTGNVTINFTGENGSVALVRNSGSTVDVLLNSTTDMYALSDRTGTNSYKLKTNTYALLIWEKDRIFIAPFI